MVTSIKLPIKFWKKDSDIEEASEERAKKPKNVAKPNVRNLQFDVSIRNTGQTSLGHFADWDLVIRYYDTAGNVGLNLEWMSYVTTSTPATLEWTVEGIYSDASSLVGEIYEPNLLNPGEEIILRANITPAIPGGTSNSITIGASNGVSIPAPFSR